MPRKHLTALAAGLVFAAAGAVNRADPPPLASGAVADSVAGDRG